MAEKLKIGLIVGTTRDGRFADRALDWFEGKIAAREDLDYEVLDLREAKLPFFDEAAPPAAKPVTSPEAQEWERKLEACDGFIVLTAEYNHSIPATIKNAFDYAFKGWHRKPIGTVGYGGVGAARAVEHLRLIAVNFGMVPVRGAVSIGGADFVKASQGTPIAELGDHLDAPARELLDDMVFWGRAAKQAKAEAAREQHRPAAR
ncbi:NADPH-dependent FMN reductase [Thioclava atlantica]|uniref:NADPH-dependent FMN reductase n=1 Tax=Thioclava atlantica TaxID=1317124 RepID=A0A085TSS2_9RHOB|nr:NAD(P)H-dependent oxidoreductase [Thioclava atlantica]KFE33769.1 NADPH-dependent FMN reductase [Thioclava atlantica]